MASCCAGKAPAGTVQSALEMEVGPEVTVRQLLADMARHNPPLGKSVVSAEGNYQGGALLVLNGSLVELAGGLDSVFNEGDVLEIVPAYMGG